MPAYCYSTPDGEIIERVFGYGEAPDEILLGGGITAKRDFRAEHNPRRAAANAWPIEPCYASGVHPEQADELRKYLSDRGCPTEVNRDGDPIYRDRHHRRRALALRGMHDRASYD